ncbi:dephospho-CoA kinase [Amycolatopsis antarctica]|uniref:Dephospho-CoA kinase n=1 Tax=Amycolatopsis antarctica TaxID=1854586 RepID=A0A263D1T7_9PSEU|nr:dephospho-CoA kinase [Amycolatopsis antarctica]OZM72169.1 dephospho-CoA kinase [Amycolatopsis antarctica]
MLRVGLTGGIGAGKSTVANRLAEHGAVIIDADLIAREVVQRGTEGLAEIVRAFGTGVLDAGGALDRPALAAKAFADEESRRTLNAIVHPRVGARTAELMERAAPDAIVVHDIPLLVEGGLAPHYHLVLVVDADPEVRVARLTDARGMTEADARARIAAQSTERQRREVADVWLDNGGHTEIVLSEVDTLWADRLVPYEANVRLRRPRPPLSPVIAEYDPSWPEQAGRVLARIRAAVGDRVERVDHIGSTSVPGLPAKDVLDLQILVPSLDAADGIADTLSEAGFPRAEGEWCDESRERDGRLPKRFHFGGDPGRPVNLHVRSPETPAWRVALLFPAWLRAEPAERDAYAAVKRELANVHEGGSTLAYADDKQDWINAAFDRAEEWAERTGWTP